LLRDFASSFSAVGHIHPPEQVPVNVEDGLYRSVPQPSGDDERLFTDLDQKGHLECLSVWGVAHLMPVAFTAGAHIRCRPLDM
jgi:hypothetical protein